MSTTIDPRYHYSLVSLFGSSFLSSLLDGSFFQKFSVILNESGFTNRFSIEATLEEILSKVYEYLELNYRAEYIYKNTITNQLLLKNHSLADAVLFTEFRADPAKLDVLIVNGTTTAYEIKTELDSLARLPHQIESYQAMFDKTCIVTHEWNVDRLAKVIPESVGISTLDSDNQIVTAREAASNKKNLRTERIFSSLRKPEYLRLIKNRFGYTPQVSNSYIYEECLALFKELSSEEAHACFVEILHSRKLAEHQLDLASRVASCLKVLLLERVLSKSECQSLDHRLQSQPFSKPDYVFSLPPRSTKRTTITG